MLIALSIAFFALPAFAKGPSRITLICRVTGLPTETIVTLQECGDNIDAYGYGSFWCSGKLSDDFTVRYFGSNSESSSNVRITFVPGKFSGVSPIEVNFTKVDCFLPSELPPKVPTK